MKFKVVLAFLVLATLAALPLAAADLTGNWKSSMETPNGTFEQTFAFKQDGDKLTGKIVSQRGEVEIKDGKISGDDFEFNVERPARGGGPARTVAYKGKVSGDKITGTMGGSDNSRPWTATREK